MTTSTPDPDTTPPPALPRIAWLLGSAGLWPQLACAVLVFEPRTRFAALGAGYLYAALILSFLGGLWWGVAISRPRAPAWLFVAAVVPSLIALASGVPWMIGAAWPEPSLLVLAVALAAAPVVDGRLHTLGLLGADLLRLRVLLSLGLAALTLLLAVA
jgi:hypothetical protein